MSGQAGPTILGFVVRPILNFCDIRFSGFTLLFILAFILHHGLNLFLFQVGLVIFVTTIPSILNDCLWEFSERLACLFHMRLEAADIRRSLLYTVRHNELVFGSNLYIASGFELTVSHVIFLHTHEGRVRIRLAEAVLALKQRLVLFVFQQSGKQIFAELRTDFFRGLFLIFSNSWASSFCVIC